MALTQAQYLLMLAEDRRAKGEALSDKMHQEYLAHAREILEDSALIDRAKEIMDHEKSRFASYISKLTSSQSAGLATQLPIQQGQARIMRKAAE